MVPPMLLLSAAEPGRGEAERYWPLFAAIHRARSRKRAAKSTSPAYVERHGCKRRRNMIKPSEREKLQDCLMLIQSARKILGGLRKEILPDWHSLDRCFHEADEKISRLLR